MATVSNLFVNQSQTNSTFVFQANYGQSTGGLPYWLTKIMKLLLALYVSLLVNRVPTADGSVINVPVIPGKLNYPQLEKCLRNFNL